MLAIRFRSSVARSTLRAETRAYQRGGRRLQRVVNVTLGSSAANGSEDINQDGSMNVVDVQMGARTYDDIHEHVREGARRRMPCAESTGSFMRGAINVHGSRRTQRRMPLQV